MPEAGADGRVRRMVTRAAGRCKLAGNREFGCESSGPIWLLWHGFEVGQPSGLFERIKFVVGFRKRRVTGTHGLELGALERFFGGDAIDPSLVGKLFVPGEIEANEKLDVGAGRSSAIGRLG